MFSDVAALHPLWYIIGVLVMWLGIVEWTYQKVLRPHKLGIRIEGACTIIRYRWIRRWPFLFGPLGLLVLAVWAIRGYRDYQGRLEWAGSLFSVALIVIGIGCLYGAIAGFVNSTVLVVSDGVIEISSGPLPVLGHRKRVLRNVTRVYYKKELSSIRTDPVWTFPVFVRMEPSGPVKVLDAIDLESAAIAVVSAMRTRLT